MKLKQQAAIPDITAFNVLSAFTREECDTLLAFIKRRMDQLRPASAKGRRKSSTLVNEKDGNLRSILERLPVLCLAHIQQVGAMDWNLCNLMRASLEARRKQTAQPESEVTACAVTAGGTFLRLVS